MVEIADIENQKTLEAWLYGLDEDRIYPIANVIASRAALRVLPVWLRYFDNKELSSSIADYAMALFRCSLASAVAPVLPTAGVKQAARSAAFSIARSPAFSAARSPLSAAETAYSTTDTAFAAALCAAISATFSAAEFTDSAGHSVIAWQSIRQDCQAALSANGEDYRPAQQQPLWPDQADPLKSEWSELSKALLADGPHWQFWIDLYERFLHGEVQNWDMLLEIVLLPDADWQQGPEHLNGLIAGIVEKYNLEGKPSSENNLAERVETSLASNQLRAAIADFTYDELSHLMRMVPFLDDIKAIDDPDLAKDRADKLSELHDGFADLAEDIRAENKNVPGHLLRNLDRYCTEASKPVEAIRPGRLWDLGTNLQTEALSEDTVQALGDGLSGHYQRMVEKHLDLMKDYFAATLARMQNVDQILLRENVDPSDALGRIKDAHDALFVDPDQSLPRLDPEDAAVLKEELDELERRKAALDATSDPSQKAAREKEYWKHVKTVSVTILRYSLKAAQVTWKGVKDLNGVVKTLSKLWPEQTRAAIERLVEILQNVPWPF